MDFDNNVFEEEEEVSDEIAPYNNTGVVEDAEILVAVAMDEFSELLSSIDVLIQSPATSGEHKCFLKTFQCSLVGQMEYVENMKLET